MTMETALTLPFVFLALVFVFIAYTFGKEAVHQKIFFIGVGWLMGILGLGSVVVVAQQSSSYGGVAGIATAGMVFLVVALLVWLIYIIGKTMKDAGTSIFSSLGK